MANALNVDIPPGAKVVVKQKYFTKPQSESARTVIVGSEGNDKMGAGFGCCKSTSGQAIFGKWADTGEECRVEGYQLQKMLPANV